MSIENSLERIAAALETIAGTTGVINRASVNTATVSINQPTAADGVAMQAAPEALKRGRGRPPKAQPNPNVPSITETQVPQTAQPNPNVPSITKADVGAKFIDLIKAGRRDDVVSILQQHGAKDLSTMDASHYASAHAAATAALSA